MTSPTNPGVQRNESRSSSLSSRLFRTKSGEALGSSRLRKGRQDSNPQQPPLPVSPPKLPEYSIQPQLGISPRMTSKEYTSNGNTPPVPPIPAQIPQKKQEFVDPYARTESMTHRGRYSYAPSTVSTLNSPRRVRRRKDPTPFNILVIGARSAGKTSFINFLKHSLALPPRKQPPQRSSESEVPPPPSTRGHRDFTSSYQEIEVDHERLGLTLWDSQGLDKGVVDLQLRELTNFVEAKFDDTFLEEVKVVRSHASLDTHIHCVFFILDPARLNQNLKAGQQGAANGAASRIGKVSRIIGALDEDFDLQVIKALQGKTVVVPVISKADTVTTKHMTFLKKKVWESLKQAGLDPLEALNFAEEDTDLIEEEEETPDKSSDDDDSSPGSPASAHTEDSDTVPGPRRPQHKREPSNLSMNTMMDSGFVPLSILSPDDDSLDGNDGPIGRQFPWGFADPFNSEHCDFVKIKDAVFSEWRSELRELSREKFYEAWRTHRLNRQGQKSATAAAPRKPPGGIPIALDNRSRA